MEILGKNIIVFGLGISGKSSVKALAKMGAKIYIYDDGDKENLANNLRDLEIKDYRLIDDLDEIKWENIDFILKSPGIKPSNNFIKLAKDKGIEVISDIELAYRIWGPDKFITITGTNGKTTTTSLVAHIINNSGLSANVEGNIGVGILWDVLNSEKDYYVIEASSFQLASIKKYASHIVAITNISPDHLDWHGSFEKYANDKKKIAKNLKEEDYLILNALDQNLLDLKNISKAKIMYFSSQNKPVSGINLNDKKLIDPSGEIIMSTENIRLVGTHNIENIMCAYLICQALGIKKEYIVNAISSFEAIEHRIEFVKEIKGVKYYNDSKGTNVDSTKKAIEGFEKGINLIAGGYDKGSEFDILFNRPEKIANLILFGSTKEKISVTAKKHGIKNIFKVDNLQNAVNIVYKKAKKRGSLSFFSCMCKLGYV